MYDLRSFSLREMTECCAAFRNLGEGATNVQEVADRMVRYLYKHFGDQESGSTSLALVRFFHTLPFGDLDATCRRLVREALGGGPVSPAMKCLTLLGTAGDQPDWNVKECSRRYRAFPLVSEEFVARFPMFSQLLKQFGVKLPGVVQAGSHLLVDVDETAFNVFYVPDAAGSPSVLRQDDFVIPYGIKSVLGFGGLLPSKEFFAVILFSKVPIPHETAELFKTLALATKLAVLPFDARRASEKSPGRIRATRAPRRGVKAERERTDNIVLHRLLDAHEQAVCKQSEKFEIAMEKLRRSAASLDRSDEALRTQTRLLHAIVRCMGEGVVVIDREGMPVLFNPVAERILGLPPTGCSLEDWMKRVGLEVPGLIAPSLKTDVPVLDVLRGGAVNNVELLIRRSGSQEGTWLDVSARTLKDETGTALGSVLVFHDLTRRKLVEEALRASEERYRMLIEQAPVVSWTADEHGRTSYISPNVTAVYGYTPEEICEGEAALWLDRIHPEDTDRVRNAYAALFTTHSFEIEYRIRRKDGQWIWAHDRAIATFEKDGVRWAQGVLLDITDLKQVEEQLQLALDRLRTFSTRLETVREEERARIARELHDELGVALTCIKIDLSRLNTMIERAPVTSDRAQLQSRIRSMVEFVDKTIPAVQRIVTQLRPSVLDDLGLVAAIEWQCRDFQKHTGIACACTASTEDIRLDPAPATAVFRICQEALTNVARHASATTVTVSLEDKPGHLVLTVQDNGVGIPEEKVTDPQSLGLLGIRERASLFGGRLSIKGSPGKGTTVTLYLPEGPKDIRKEPLR